ncbi:hypothetical protein, partial [Reichenbachiella sp. MALMAid0571]|uniref:hypothetical protein n=1 Tax=Reichenbachiella sp. MALMAid0571 TaxID=3143939 RepID=UPI0032DEBE38
LQCIPHGKPPCSLLMVRDTTLAHKGLAPYKLIPYFYVGKDAHAGHTHGLRKHRGSVVIGSSELLESPPSQNFDNEKSKVNYKNIWLG